MVAIVTTPLNFILVGKGETADLFLLVKLKCN